MGVLHHLRSHRGHRVVNFFTEMLSSSRLTEMRHEAVVDHSQRFFRVSLTQITDTGVHHEQQKVQDQLPIVPQEQHGINGLLLEDLIPITSLTTHTLHHGLVDTERLEPDIFVGGLLAQNETKVEMEEVTILGNHEILEMPVTDGHQVGNGSIACGRLEVVLHDFVDVQVVFFCAPLEVNGDVTFVLELYFLDGTRVFDELHHAIVWAAGDALVGSESKVEVDLFQQNIKHRNDLQNELILT